MGLSLRKLFKAREKPGEDVQRVSSVEITDQQVRDAVTEICLRELAFWTCVGKIANALTKCEFRTFYEGEELFKDEYYLWNYEPNRNQNKAEFLSKAMEQLFRNNELLIVESYDGQLLVADDFSVTKNALYGDTYTNVQVDDYTFSRSFRSSDVLHWTLNNKNVNRIIQHLYDSYSKLIDYSAKSYLKSRGSRGILDISAMAQSDKLFNEKLEKLMNEYFKSFFESPNAVLPLFEGYSYTDIGSKTYSEGTSRDIKSQYDDIFDFTARGFSMPPTLANSNSYQSSIPPEWNVDAECPRRYSKVFVYYNCVFTSTEKSNFVVVWNLVGDGTCITGKTVTILSTFYFYKHSSLKINSVNFQFMRFWIRIQIQVAFYISDRIYRNKTWLHFFNIYN